jgi:hypothetical protein
MYCRREMERERERVELRIKKIVQIILLPLGLLERVRRITKELAVVLRREREVLLLLLVHRREMKGQRVLQIMTVELLVDRREMVQLGQHRKAMAMVREQLGHQILL